MVINFRGQVFAHLGVVAGRRVMGKEWAWLQTQRMLNRWEGKAGGGRAQGYPGSYKQHQCLGVLFPQGPGVLPLQKRGARLPRWAANLLSRVVELTLAEASSPEPGLGNNWL